MGIWFCFPGRVNAESLYPFPTLRVIYRNIAQGTLGTGLGIVICIV